MVDPPGLVMRADNFRYYLHQVWERLWPPLSRATSDQEIIDAFVENAQPYAREFVPAMANLIFRVLHEKKFPKRRETQINFLADSLAALGMVKPRTSRDICERERTRKKRAHHIVQYEFSIVCSCGFKGQSLNHGCPTCGAQIDFGFRPPFW